MGYPQHRSSLLGFTEHRSSLLGYPQHRSSLLGYTEHRSSLLGYTEHRSSFNQSCLNDFINTKVLSKSRCLITKFNVVEFYRKHVKALNRKEIAESIEDAR